MKKALTVFVLLLSALFLSCATDAEDEFDASKVCPVSKRGTFVDARDGRVYKYTTIGDQVWMAENLNYDVEGSHCEYENDCQNRGRRYYVDIAEKSCPAGWHLPNNEEWFELFDNVGGRDIAALHLRSSTEWIAIDSRGVPEGNDECGFSVLPQKTKTNRDGIETRILSSKRGEIQTSSSKTNAGFFIFMGIENQVKGLDDLIRESCFYVRCVKD